MVPAITNEDCHETFTRLAEEIPVVFCNRAVDGVKGPKVFSNNFFGAYLATKHLLSNGYKRIAYITKQWYPTAMERFQGYISALNEAHIETDEALYTFETDEEGKVDVALAAKNLLSQNHDVDAIFCFNDTIAKSVYPEVLKAGYEVGINFGMVGYDNTHICDQMPVKLTSVQFKTYEIGKEAAGLMIRMMNGENIPSNKVIVLQPQLEIRESSLHKARM